MIGGRGGFTEGEGEGVGLDDPFLFPSGVRPPANPKGPLFVLSWDINF